MNTHLPRAMEPTPPAVGEPAEVNMNSIETQLNWPVSGKGGGTM